MRIADVIDDSGASAAAKLSFRRASRAESTNCRLQDRRHIRFQVSPESSGTKQVALRLLACLAAASLVPGSILDQTTCFGHQTRELKAACTWSRTGNLLPLAHDERLTAYGAGERAQMAATAANKEWDGDTRAAAAASSSGDTYRMRRTAAVSFTCRTCMVRCMHAW